MLLVHTLPINNLSLKLFTLIINAVLLMMVSGVISGFTVHGFWSAVFGSVLISIVSWFLSSFINDQGRMESIRYINVKKGDDDRWK
ncbi:MAG: phage holin family protein [Deltaproteobacteria bacterium]|nr:phage holin family protein [Deltaproteobacteria bacterium]